MGAMTISVIIPAYNRAATVGRAINSVLGQSLPPMEILVVDDGSEDDTVRIAGGYVSSRVPVRCLVSGANSGAQAARNRGIREARGEWIAFLDSDDEWESNKLALQVGTLGKRDFRQDTVVHGDCWRQVEGRSDRELWRLPLVDGVAAHRQLLCGPGPMFQGLLVSKLALEQIGLLDENVPAYQEWDTALRLARACPFVHVREPLFTYHCQRSDSISKTFRRDLDGYHHVVEAHRQEILSGCGEEVYNAHHVWNAVRAMYRDFFPEARSSLKQVHDNGINVALLKWLAAKDLAPRPLCRWLSKGLVLDWQRRDLGC